MRMRLGVLSSIAPQRCLCDLGRGCWRVSMRRYCLWQTGMTDLFYSVRMRLDSEISRINNQLHSSQIIIVPPSKLMS
jgi:hypothetical protein